MISEVRSFRITEASREEDQTRIAAFLRAVEVLRVDTAYADGAWQILVHYQDLRRREETAQIASAIVDALNGWRGRIGGLNGMSRDQVLADEAIREIARVAPTTERELATLAALKGWDTGDHGPELVAIVRDTMSSLVD
ncbi:MAG: aldolase [Azospirillum sp.]|nr:aldolase [Azospirillum sp.]